MNCSKLFIYLFRVLATIMVVGIFLTSIHSSLPGTTVPKLKPSIATNLRTILPQGWNFFTKDPLEDYFFVYLINGQQLENTSLGVNTYWKNMFGLKRVNRAQNVEIANLLFEFSKKEFPFIFCKTSVVECFRANQEICWNVSNVSKSPTICGPTVFARMRTLPWAYRKLSDTQFRLKSILIVQVDCPALSKKERTIK